MECPNCGFIQPEEQYCANCGAHIPKALTERRRKAVAATLVMLVCLVLIGSGVLFWARRHLYSSQPLQGQERSGPTIERLPSTSSSSTVRPLQKIGAKRQSKEVETKGGKKVQEVHQGPAPNEQTQPSPKDLMDPNRHSPKENETLEKDVEAELKRWAAQEWVAKARELADYSREELEFYKKALEADPSLALAYYRIGLIQWKWGLRDPALEAFRKFWLHATKEERERYPVPADFTPEELGPARETD